MGRKSELTKEERDARESRMHGEQQLGVYWKPEESMIKELPYTSEEAEALAKKLRETNPLVWKPKAKIEKYLVDPTPSDEEKIAEIRAKRQELETKLNPYEAQIKQKSKEVLEKGGVLDLAEK